MCMYMYFNIDLRNDFLKVFFLNSFSEDEKDKELDVDYDDDDDDMEIDVVGVADTPSRPYNYHKVKNIMNECYQHMNLIRIPLENNDLELEK